MLTAIVIGFATTALLLVVLLVSRGLTGSDHVDGRESALMDWTRHLLIVPILLPLVTGAALLLIDETRHALKALISLASTVLLLVAAMALMRMADGVPDGTARCHRPLPSRTGPRRSRSCSYLDRLSALMLVLTSVLGTCSLVFSWPVGTGRARIFTPCSSSCSWDLEARSSQGISSTCLSSSK